MVLTSNRTPFSLLILSVWLALGHSFSLAEPVDFHRDVGPILQQHCLNCHNDRDRRGSLSLQSADAILRGGDSSTLLVPGEPESSYLLDLVTPSDGRAEMPKGEPPLDKSEVDVLRRWIAAGADWPDGVVLEPPSIWSLKPLRRPDVPTVSSPLGGFSIRSPIDAFAAARYEESKLTPATQADRRTLIRRLSLDLTGLPPAIEAVEAFVADNHPQAYERLVDELLASPHFGERWGRHWLDIARYADSEGYLGDSLRPHAWVYREWVINAINRDLPFDQFTIEQLAGDLLEDSTVDQKIATGFHRNTLRNTEAGVDLELYRTKEIVDRVNTTAMTWLGLTFGCAECHDHKHDPISQTDFYQLYAFFNNADEVGVTVTPSWEVSQYQQEMRSWRPVWGELVSLLQQYRMDQLTEEQQELISAALAESGRSFDWKKIADLHRTDQSGWDELKTAIDAHLRQRPTPPSTKARAFAERRQDRRDTFIHLRGIYSRPGDKVSPDTPAVLPALDTRGEVPDRLDLARWLFQEANPLTARVAVNRIWQHLFGQGLVSTPDDFGSKGAIPTHPKLLDWLATEYRRLGWSRKAMIRQILMSSTYRLASEANVVPSQELLGNELLWRQNSFRVDAEIIRDLHLTASGLLDRTIGRRGIHPPLPEFVTEVGRSVNWPVSQGSERFRRGMYIFFKRTVPYPMLMTFDAPDSTVSCSRRNRSNTSLQALTLLNDPVFYECAQTLGGQLCEQHPEDVSTAVDVLFRRCLARPPDQQERNSLMRAHEDLLHVIEVSEQDGWRKDSPQRLAMIALARIVMNLDEFVTRN
jgi:hypothetical protein